MPSIIQSSMLKMSFSILKNEIMEQMRSICDMVGQYMQKNEEEKRIAEDQAAKDRYWKIPICYDDDDDEESSIPLKDIIISGLPPCVAITPVLLTEEPVDSLIMEDEHLDTIPATESESEGIPDSVCDVPLCNNPTPLEAFKEHSETIIDSNNYYSLSDDGSDENIDYVDASPPDVEIVSLEVVEIVIPEVEGIDTIIPFFSNNQTISFVKYLLKAFYSDDDHIKEKSSGSTTTHADFSQYDSFIIDLSINPFPPADRSDFYHEEFAGELAHIISLPEYDCLCFKIEPKLGNLTIDEVEDIFPTREPRVHVPNVLPTHPTLHLDMDFILSSESLFLSYVVWIFLPILTYPVAPPYLLSCRNEDTIFDPGISIYHSFMPGVSHQNGTFMKFNDCPDSEASHAHVFVLRSQELQILGLLLGTRI
ncbi:hypothetical protein Tco_1335532 [Tanacetum coccineum]